jgi:senataxin
MQSSEWFLVKISNLTSLCREYEGVRNVRYLPFVDHILRGKNETTFNGTVWNLQNPMCSTMANLYNTEQMEAITSGTLGAPIMLIQGPPGTGKTRTILGIIAIALQMGSSGYFSHLARCSTLPRNKYTIVSRSTKKAHILICAPSNSALDEITIRVIDKGLLNEQGQMFTPHLVRVGLNIHPTVLKVSLQHILDTEIEHVKSLGKIISRYTKRSFRLKFYEKQVLCVQLLVFQGLGYFHK